MAKLWLLSVAGMALLAPAISYPQPASTETYPSKPIRLIVPSAAGGAPDIGARSLASEMSTQMGQQVVVDNRPGASGIVGLEMAARAAPDGYTLSISQTLSRRIRACT